MHMQLAIDTCLGDPWSPPHTESPLRWPGIERKHVYPVQTQHPFSQLSRTTAQPTVQDRLSSATNGWAPTDATGVMLVKIAACMSTGVTSPLCTSWPMSSIARYCRAASPRTKPGSRLSLISCLTISWLLHIECTHAIRPVIVLWLLLMLVTLIPRLEILRSLALRFGQSSQPSPMPPRRRPSTPTHMFDNKSRPGPNSRGYSHTSAHKWTLMIILVCHLVQATRATVADARVRFPQHPGNLEANHRHTLPQTGAKPSGDWRHNIRHTGEAQPVRKRAFRRALQRARLSETQSTMYRGRRLFARSPPCRSSGTQATKTAAYQTALPRLRVVSWNAGGLAGHRYQELNMKPIAQWTFASWWKLVGRTTSNTPHRSRHRAS